MGIPTLDFSKIDPWKTIDIYRACSKLSEDSNRYNMMALLITQRVFELIQDHEQQTQFFFNCSQLGLRGRKIEQVFIFHCQSNYQKFIELVLKTDASISKFLIEEEGKAKL